MNEAQPQRQCCNSGVPLWDAWFDQFWKAKKSALTNNGQNGKLAQMEFTVSKNQQFAVTADNPDDAIKKFLNGEGKQVGTSNYSVQERPQVPGMATGGTAVRPIVATGG